MSDEVTVKVSENGPYIIKGGPTVTDAEGKQIECKAIIALCRCGMSSNKPFCDGTHKEKGWTA